MSGDVRDGLIFLKTVFNINGDVVGVKNNGFSIFNIGTMKNFV